MKIRDNAGSILVIIQKSEKKIKIQALSFVLTSGSIPADIIGIQSANAMKCSDARFVARRIGSRCHTKQFF